MHFHARSVLVATGATYRRLGVPGEDELIGAGIHFCATCDGPFYKGSHQLVVIGGGNSACEEGLHLTKFTDKVTLLVRGSELTASQILIDKVSSHEKIEILYHTEAQAFIDQDSKLKSVEFFNNRTGQTSELNPAAAFVFIGQLPNSEFLDGYLERDQWGYILSGHDLIHGRESEWSRQPFAFESSVPGVFVAGDVRHGSTKQVASAVGEGAAAALMIGEYLKTV
jgi:thioredoxin reductase (NADPH)